MPHTPPPPLASALLVLVLATGGTRSDTEADAPLILEVPDVTTVLELEEQSLDMGTRAARPSP